MPTFKELDAITQGQLAATGATKWTDPAGRIGAFIAEMDYGIAPAITAALHEAVEAGNFGYPTLEADAELAAATAAHLTRSYNWAVPENAIFPMVDVISVYKTVIERFTTPGSPIIVPTPAYMPFLIVAGDLGRPIIEVPLTKTVSGPTGQRLHYSYDLAAIDEAFATSSAELLVLCNPHNPTGRSFTAEELLAVAQIVDHHQARVFSDEIWAPLTYPEYDHIPYASLNDTTAAHTITGVAASKAFNLPGLKCAQLITTNPADQQKFAAEGHWDMHGAANLGRTATIAAWNHGEPWLNDIRAYLARNRDLLVSSVEEHFPDTIRLTAPEGTYVGWLDFTDHPLPADQTAADFLAETAGVLCTDGAACGQAGIGHIRLIYAMPYPILGRALEQIRAAVS